MPEQANLFSDINHFLSPKEEVSEDEVIYPLTLNIDTYSNISYGLDSYIDLRKSWLDLAEGEFGEELRKDGIVIELLLNNAQAQGRSYDEGIASDLRNRFSRSIKEVPFGEAIHILINLKELKEIGRVLGPERHEDIDHDSFFKGNVAWAIYCESFVKLHDAFVAAGGQAVPELREQFEKGPF